MLTDISEVSFSDGHDEALFTLVGRNLPALSFLSARHIESPLRVKHIFDAQIEQFFCVLSRGVRLNNPCFFFDFYPFFGEKSLF